MNKFDIQIKWEPSQFSIKIEGTTTDVMEFYKNLGADLEEGPGTSTMELTFYDLEINQTTTTPGRPSKSWLKKWFGRSNA
jgi:hypothetical protein